MLENLDLCDHHAHRIWRVIGGRVPLDDLLQEGRLALLLAADRYDAGRSATFRTFADRAVRGGMIDSIRRWNHSRCQSRPIAIELTDVHVAANWQLACEAAIDIERLAAKLTPKQRTRVSEHLEMSAGLISIRELGERSGITEAGEQHRLGVTRRLLAAMAGLKRKRNT